MRLSCGWPDFQLWRNFSGTLLDALGAWCSPDSGDCDWGELRRKLASTGKRRSDCTGHDDERSARLLDVSFSAASTESDDLTSAAGRSQRLRLIHFFVMRTVRVRIVRRPGDLAQRLASRHEEHPAPSPVT